MASNFTPEEQAMLADRTTRSFGGKQIGNANRAKQALSDYPDFANRMAVQAGIRKAVPNNSDRDDSMREFRVDDAVYKSLQNADGSMPEEAKPAPRASSGGSRKSGAVGGKIARDTAPSEGGREARAEAEAKSLNSRDGGFHRTGKTAVPDGGAEVGLNEKSDNAGMAGKLAAGAGVVGTLGYLLHKYYSGQGGGEEAPGRVSDPMGHAPVEEPAAPREPGRGVATRPQVYEGEIEPRLPATTGQRGASGGNMDAAIESSIADTALPPPQEALPAPQDRLAYAPGQDPRANGEDYSGPRQLKKPPLHRQYPTPGELDPRVDYADVLAQLRGQPDSSGVARTIGRGAPKVRVPGR